MFWSKLCKSNWNSVWNLAFAVFTLTYCMEYVWKSSIRIGIFQRATQRAKILLTGNTQSGGSSSVNYYKLLYCTMCYLFFFTEKEFGKRFLFIQILLSKKKILLAILYYYYCQLLVLLLTKLAAFSRGCKSRITLITG